MPTHTNTIIESLGVYLPPKSVSIADVLLGCHNTIRFPLERMTGIKSRPTAGEDEFCIELATKAMQDCLARSQYEPEDIDCLIYCSISRIDGPSPHYSAEPSYSVRLKKHFGLGNALVFDISNACAGMFTAVYLVDAFIKVGLIRCGMVVSGEYTTHIATTAQKEIQDFFDPRLACLTVGDAGAAVILKEAQSDSLGFHAIDLFTLGKYSPYVITKPTDQVHGGVIMFTDAIRSTAAGIKEGLKHAQHMLNHAGFSPEAFQHLILHQTSETSLNDAVREANSQLNRKVFDKGNTFYNLTHRGNTATTSHFVVLMDGIQSRRIRSGDRIIFGISGAGLNLGTALYTLDDLPNRILHPQLDKKDSEEKPWQQSHLHSPIATPQVRIESVGVVPPDGDIAKDTLQFSIASGKNCFARSVYKPSDINLVIYAGIYRSNFIAEPAIAATIADAFNMNADCYSTDGEKTFAFDVLNGSLGMFNACHIAIQLIKAKKIKNAMIFTSEVENNAEFFPEKLLGIEETGAAIILDAVRDEKVGFGGVLFKYYTEYIDSAVSSWEQENGKTYVQATQDPRVDDYYCACIVDAVDELLAAEGLDVSQIAAFFPPQRSSRLLSQLSQHMKIDKDKFINVKRRNNNDLLSSSLPCSLRAALDHGVVKNGDIGLMISVGSGIQVGAAVYYF